MLHWFPALSGCWSYQAVSTHFWTNRSWQGLNNKKINKIQQFCLCLIYVKNDVRECSLSGINTLRPRQNGRHFPEDTFKLIFFNENVRISIKISLKFVAKGPINNVRSLVQIMAWRRPGDKPLSEPITRPQLVNPEDRHMESRAHLNIKKIVFPRYGDSQQYM